MRISKQSGQNGCELSFVFLTYRVKTRAFAHTDYDDYKGYGGPFLFETFDLLLMEIFC